MSHKDKKQLADVLARSGYKPPNFMELPALPDTCRWVYDGDYEYWSNCHGQSVDKEGDFCPHCGGRVISEKGE